MTEIESKLKARYDALANDTAVDVSKEKLLYVVLNSYDAIEAISNNPAAMAAYKNIIGKYKNMNVCVLLGGIENANVSYSAPEIIKKARDAKHFMFFDDMQNMKIVDMPLAVIRNFKKPIELGDCYYIRDNDCVKIKSALML